MSHCRECGAPVARGDDFCSECGSPVESPPDSHSGDRRSGADRKESRPRNESRGKRSREREHQGRSGGRAPPRDASREPRGGADSSRRNFLKYGAGVAGIAALAGGGWFASQELLGGMSPAGVVKAFYQRLRNGNLQGARALVHPKGPTDPPTQESVKSMKDSDISILDVRTLSKSNGVATVELKIEATVFGQTRKSTSEVTLRKHNGKWKIWE